MSLLKKIVAPAVLFGMIVGTILFFLAIAGTQFGFDSSDKWAFAIYAVMAFSASLSFATLAVIKLVKK